MRALLAIFAAVWCAGCRGAPATVTLNEIPGRYRVSSVSAEGLSVQSYFSLRSTDTRSPTVRSVLADVSVSGSRIGRFGLDKQFRLGAQSASPALMSGRIDFRSITQELYRSLFRAQIPYRLLGEANVSYRGLRRSHSIEGGGNLPRPAGLSVTFADNTASRLVSLESARLDAAPSSSVAVGVEVKLTVTNPFTFPISLVGATYELKLGNEVFMRGHTGRSRVLEPGPNPLQFRTLVLPVRGVPDLASRLSAGKDLGISASGEITLEESGQKLVLHLIRP